MLPTVALYLVLQTPTLADLEAKASQIKPGGDWQAANKIREEVNNGIVALITENKLKPEDFERASQIVSATGNDFRTSQMQYELSLAGLAAGNENSAKNIAMKWDMFLMTMGRHRRIGAVNFPESERYRVQPTGQGIIDAMKDSAKAEQTAAASKNNEEIQKIVDADQADRRADFSKMTMEQMNALSARDKERLKRIREMVAKGEPKTGADFFNAALVCQHGDTFDDYATAHELSVVATMLGDKRSAWLAGASYDRMLINSGHPQRFTTQYSLSNGVTTLQWFDPERINDTIRVAVVKKTLAQAKAVKFD